MVARGPNEDLGPSAVCSAYTKDKKQYFPVATQGQSWLQGNGGKGKAAVKYKHSEAFAALYICD